jgi:capsular polysaccharide biosynthesis protein
LREPSLLILDEATSALDSENERRIQKAIEGLHGRMTILVITHRLSTIRGADVIYVLERGRLVESGSWEVLVERAFWSYAGCRTSMLAKCPLELRLSFDTEGYKLSEPMNIRPESRAFEEPAEGEFIFPLRSLLQAVWRRLWVVVLIVTLFVGTAVGWSIMQTPIYEASVRVLVGQGGGLAQDPAYVESLQKLTGTVGEAVYTRPVAEEVAGRMDPKMSPEEVLAGVDAQPLPETQFIDVNYSHPDPEVAREVVNTVGEVLSERIANTSNGSITARVWGKAETPTTAVSPKPTYNGFFALVLGVFVGLVLVYLLEYLDDSWRSPEDAERVSGVPNLAAVPKFTVAKSSKVWKQN